MCPFGNILFGNVFKMFLAIFSFKLSEQNDFFQGHRGAERALQQSTAASITFQKEHMPKRAHSIGSTLTKEHMPKRAYAEKSKCRKKHMAK